MVAGIYIYYLYTRVYGNYTKLRNEKQSNLFTTVYPFRIAMKMVTTQNFQAH